jgi:hypothetical protein
MKEVDQDWENQLAALKTRIAQTDFKETASRIGAVYDGTRLILKIMGRRVGVDSSGKVATEIHTNPRFQKLAITHGGAFS